MLPIWIHDGEEVDVVEVDNVLVLLVALDQLLQDVGHGGGTDPLTGVDSYIGDEKVNTVKEFEKKKPGQKLKT